MKERPLRCTYGCGRLVLPSRMADHYLISAAEHAVAKVRQDTFEWAYNLLREDK